MQGCLLCSYLSFSAIARIAQTQINKFTAYQRRAPPWLRKTPTAQPFFHHSVFRPNGPTVLLFNPTRNAHLKVMCNQMRASDWGIGTVGPLGRRVNDNGRVNYLSAATRLPGRCPSLGERLGLRPACCSASGAWFAPNAIRLFGSHVVRPSRWIWSASYRWFVPKRVPQRGVGSPSEGQRPANWDAAER